jgi:hypothetical protein
MNYLFKNASLAITELIYTAWIQAGSPSNIFEGHSDSGHYPQVYPIPATRELNIQLHTDPSTPVSIRLFSEQGRVVAATTGYSVFSKLDLGDVPPSTYYLLIESAGMRYIKKILIVH